MLPPPCWLLSLLLLGFGLLGCRLRSGPSLSGGGLGFGGCRGCLILMRLGGRGLELRHRLRRFLAWPFLLVEPFLISR